ncbi:MAG: sugar phosphate isomerase/epimerase [Ruminococcaceae bacterium]|nr:sugar phosphate isomerase/epimerase [Oscillospiraceae bacterium]
MKSGVSTSCLYPLETAQALTEVQNAGVENVEIFLNTYSELEPPYIETLVRTAQEKNTNVLAVHPFSCSMESFFFATDYPLRQKDGFAFYEKYFIAAKALGAKLFVFHGDYTKTPFPFKKHCENIVHLRELAREYGVEFCQENVARCKCGRIDYIKRMREYTNDDISFVLDVKQARRAKQDPLEMIDAMSGKIAHIHMSDETEFCDCALPGEGCFDTGAFFKQLIKSGFDGSIVTELYRGDFKEVAQLAQSVSYINEQFALAKA